MLIHPPIVFLGYTLWTVPFALAAVALVSGQLDATGFVWRGPGRWPRGPCWEPASCWAPIGPTKNSGGAATGAGTRWRTAR